MENLREMLVIDHWFAMNISDKQKQFFVFKKSTK